MFGGGGQLAPYAERTSAPWSARSLPSHSLQQKLSAKCLKSQIMRFKMLKLLILTLVLVISESTLSAHDRRLLWRLKCDVWDLDESSCPMDGGWTPWSPWSTCQGSCDQIGHRTRTRDCTNPPPALGGFACSGPEEEADTCHVTNCTADEFRALVEGDSGRTEAMRLLETVPALMDRCLPEECSFEAIETALSVDNTWQLNPENIWNALLCVKHNLGCPVIGGWGVWGEWSACGARCGNGWKWRLRWCDTPFPSEARYVCSGSPLDAKSCEGDQCAIERRSTGGAWSEWGKWSTCTESCGVGVRRRRRTCVENQTPLISGSWGTHCRGQHDQLHECSKKQCTLVGGWSGWSDWGPCSKTCGSGKRSRSRSCTRPIPSGGGAPCAGPKTEVGSCYLAPCDVYIHTVALFNGVSYLKFNFDNKLSTLIHWYIRFMPLSPQGNLLFRGGVRSGSSYFRLVIRQSHICIETYNTHTCNIPKLCSHEPVEPAVWHTAMVTLSPKSLTLRVDDNLTPKQLKFTCQLKTPERDTEFIVGERFYGEIQEVIYNFTPLNISVGKGHRSVVMDQLPAVARNVAYELANLEEGFVLFDKEHYFRVPCFVDPDDWKLELTLKPKREYGTILFIPGTNQWLHVSLQNSRLRVKLAMGDYRSESTSATECPKGQWLDVTITKQLDANSIETLINGGERLHVLLDPHLDRKPKSNQRCDKPLQYPEESTMGFWVEYTKLRLCLEEYFVAGVPGDIKNKISELFTPFYGYIASIRFNNILYDIQEISRERSKANTVQLSSRTASVSDFYRETSWGESEHLNLSCLHARQGWSSNDIQWLSLDSGLFTPREMYANRKKDQRILRLIVVPNADLRGFYTCRVHSGKHTRNIITYGVMGKTHNKLSEPDTTTSLAVFTTIALVSCTLGWLFLEGIHDLNEGHGFFRDAQLTCDETANAICKFIDNNKDLYGTPSAVEYSKATVQRRVFKRMSEANFVTQEPQGMLNDARINENVPIALDLPALPEITSMQVEAPENVFRFEPNYVSTPQHGSITSPRKKLTSSSSLEVVSPRVLCSRMIAAKCRLSPRDNMTFRKFVCCPSIIRKTRSNIWKTAMTKKKMSEKILYMFGRLQRDV